MAKDPVCGKEIDEEEARQQTLDEEKVLISYE